MKRIALTLIELIVVVVIVGILATLAIPSYQNVVEASKTKVCETNLKALKTALDIYVMENDTVPGNLSELPPKYISDAYARLLQEKGAWKIKLAYFIVNQQQKGFAYAASFMKDVLAKGDIKLITCPADPTPPVQGGISYGFNRNLANKNRRDYRHLSRETLIIADCDSITFNPEAVSTELAARHTHHNIFFQTESYAQRINAGHKVGRIFEIASIDETETTGGIRAKRGIKGIGITTPPPEPGVVIEPEPEHREEIEY